MKKLRDKLYLGLIFLSVFFLFPGTLLGQEKILIGTDTLIVISPENLRTINSIIVERNSMIVELDLVDSALKKSEALVKDLKKTVAVLEEQLEINARIIALREQELEDTKKINRKIRILEDLGYSGFLVAVIVLAIL